MRGELSPIQPYVDKKLDCYQNNVATLLNHYGCEVDLLGAPWPWEFTYRKKRYDAQILVNVYNATDKRILEYFGYQVVRGYFTKDSIFETLIDKLKSAPVFINLDQYYVPHHFKNIYMLKHGPHSLLLLYYNQASNAFSCIDTYPEFKGEIGYDTLEKGILAFPYDYAKLQYSQLFASEARKKSHREIFEDFKLSARAFYSRPPDITFSTPYLLEMLLSSRDTLSEADFFAWLKSMSEGTWMWEIDRKPQWTQAYLNTDYVKSVIRPQTLEKMITLIKLASAYTTAAMRYIYKSALTRSMPVFNKGIDSLSAAIERQKQLYSIISDEV